MVVDYVDITRVKAILVSPHSYIVLMLKGFHNKKANISTLHPNILMKKVLKYFFKNAKVLRITVEYNNNRY